MATVPPAGGPARVRTAYEEGAHPPPLRTDSDESSAGSDESADEAAPPAPPPPEIAATALHGNSWAPDQILFMALLHEVGRQDSEPQSETVRTWLTSVDAVPFATSGTPPRIATATYEELSGALDSSPRALNDNRLDHEVMLWIECAVLARYATARSLEGAPLTLEEEGGLLSCPRFDALNALAAHATGLDDRPRGRATVAVACLAELLRHLEALGIKAGVTQVALEPASDVVALLVGTPLGADLVTTGRGLPPLIRHWRTLLDKARRGSDSDKASAVVAIRTTLFFTKFFFLRSRLIYTSASSLRRGFFGTLYNDLIGKLVRAGEPQLGPVLTNVLVAPLFVLVGLPLLGLEMSTQLVRSAFGTSWAFASDYGDRIRDAYRVLTRSPTNADPPRSLAALEHVLQAQLCRPLFEHCLAVDGRLLVGPRQYAVWQQLFSRLVKVEVTEADQCRSLLQFIALLHPVATGRRELTSRPVVPIVGLHNAGKSTLAHALFPEAATAAGVRVGSAEHTSFLTPLLTRELVLIDCPAMDHLPLPDAASPATLSAGGGAGLTLELCALARAVIVVIDVDQGNTGTTSAVLQTILAAAVASRSIQRVLICCNKLDDLWRKIEQDSVDRLMVTWRSDPRLRALSKAAALDAAYALAKGPATEMTLRKLSRSLLTVHDVATRVAGRCSLQIDAVPAILGESYGRGLTPVEEIIPLLTATAEAAAEPLRHLDGDAAIPRPPPSRWHVWSPSDVRAWLQRDATSVRMDELIFEATAPLGRGAFGVVFAATLHGQRVAVKLFSRIVSAMSESVLRALHEEIEHQAALAHVHVMPILATACGQVPPQVADALASHFTRLLDDAAAAEALTDYWSGRFVGIVMPFADGGSLRGYLDSVRISGHVVALRGRATWLAQVATGLAYMHAEGHNHGDLKAANVLLRRGRALICDFGLARAVSRDPMRSLDAPAVLPPRGTPYYMAPELLRREGRQDARRATDTYAFAVMAAEVLCGGTDPVPVPPVGSTPRLRHESDYVYHSRCVIEGGRQALPAGLPEPLVQLLRECWAMEAGERPVMSAVAARLAAILADHRELEP